MMSQTSSLYHHLLFLILIAQIKLSPSSFTNMKGSRLSSFLLFEFEFVSSLPLLHWHIPRVGGGEKRAENLFQELRLRLKFLVTPYVFTQHEYIIYLNWSNSILNTILLPFLFFSACLLFFSATLENPSTSNVVLFFLRISAFSCRLFLRRCRTQHTQKWWRWLLGIFHLANRKVCKCWYFLCKCISSSSSTAFHAFFSSLLLN